MSPAQALPRGSRPTHGLEDRPGPKAQPICRLGPRTYFPRPRSHFPLAPGYGPQIWLTLS